ncbi:MAG: family 10 glycosylhydrolase [Candidatus Sumerlaeia bacterium]|nr:family 10 glycosylhydrolase [Candidatus Sumerlaeia bacterium]
MNRFASTFASALVAGVLALSAVNTAQAEDRVLWVSVGDNLGSSASMDSAIAYANANNFNAIAVLARYRTNRTYINNRDFSTFTNTEPSYVGGFDTIQYVLDRVQEINLNQNKKIRVYAAWSVFLSTDGSNTLPSQLNSSWRQWVYNSGTPALATTADDSSGIWIDPSSPGAQAYNQQIIQDFIQNYDVDGIILDRIRHPGNDWGYNPDVLDLYWNNGVSPQLDADPNIILPTPTNDTFEEARRDGVTKFLADTQVLVHALKPHVIYGGTPVVFGSTDTDTLLSVFQDYPEWSSRSVSTSIRTTGAGVLDVMMPQFYRTNPATNNSLMDLFDSKITLANMRMNPLFGSFLADTQGADLAQNICHSNTNGYNGFGIFALSSLQDVANLETNNRFVELEAYNSGGCGPNVITADASAGTQYTNKVGWDSTPTADISNLAAANSGFGIQLTWSAPSGAAKYLIYRDTDSNVEPYYSNLLNKDYNITTNSFFDTPDNGLALGETYFYRVVTVDGFNNKADSNTPAGVTFSGEYVIVESRNAAGTLTPSPTYSETGSFSDTSAKADNALLSSPSGARFSITVGNSATFRPAIASAGLYDVYYTMEGGAANSSAEANSTYSFTSTLGGNVSGSFNIDKDLIEDDFVKVNSTPIEVNAGASGVVTLTFTNVDGDGAGGAAGNRFVMDSVLFLKVGNLPGGNPSCTTITPVTSTPTNADSLVFTFVFDEAVTNFNNAADVVVNTTGTAANTGVSIVQNTTSNYTVTVTGVSGDGTITVAASTTSDIRDVDTNSLIASVTSSAIEVDNTAPALTAVSPTVKVTGSIPVTLANGPETVVSTVLYSRLNGGAWSSVGTFSGATFNYTPPADGNTDFYVVSTDAAGNSNPVPTGLTVAQDTTIYSDTLNDLQLNVAAGTTQLFPMTDLQGVNIDYTNVTVGGPVRVQRIIGNAAPTGFAANRLIDEHLDITGTFTGTASFLWQYTNTGNAGSNTTVYKDTGSIVTSISGGNLVFGINSVTVLNQTSFSDWYLGDASADVPDWSILD